MKKVIFFILFLFPILQVLFVSLIIQIKVITDSAYRKRYSELGHEFSLAFYMNVFFDLLLFVILFLLFWFIFFQTLNDNNDWVKNLFVLLSLMIMIFDILFFCKIAPDNLSELKSSVPLFMFPTIPTFATKKIAIIANPMSSWIYWMVLIIFVVSLYLSLKC